MKRIIIALEGLVHAGKSTLVKTLSERINGIQCVGEYIEFATSKFPNFPHNLNEAREARQYFLALEEMRRACIRRETRCIVLDRSILSILAYHFAVELTTNREVPCFDETINTLSLEDWLFPNMCIYLDVSDVEIAKRHLGQTGKYSPVLLDPTFNSYLRRFYEDVILKRFPLLKMVRVDAHNSPEKVFSQVVSLLKKYRS